MYKIHPSTAGSLLKWSIELNEFDLRYESHRAIKAQSLADFIVETSFTRSQAELVEDAIKKRATKKVVPSLIEEKERPPDCWILHVDGSSSKDKGGAGITLISPDEEIKYEKALRFKFNVSNNQAENEALIAGIELARDIGLTKIVIHSDSQLIVNQVKGEYGVLNAVLMKRCNMARNILRGFEFWELVQIDRPENSRADSLSKSAGPEGQSSVGEPLVEYVEMPAINRPLIMEIDEVEKNWVVEMKEFLDKGELPPDEEKAKLIKVTSPRFTVQDGVLYRKSFSKPLMRCVEPNLVQKVLF